MALHMKALFSEHIVPPARFAHGSLPCPYSLGSVQLPAALRDGKRRNPLLPLPGRVKDSSSQKRRCTLSLSLALWSHRKTRITISSPREPIRHNATTPAALPERTLSFETRIRLPPMRPVCAAWANLWVIDCWRPH